MPADGSHWRAHKPPQRPVTPAWGRPLWSILGSRPSRMCSSAVEAVPSRSPVPDDPELRAQDFTNLIQPSAKWIIIEMSIAQGRLGLRVAEQATHHR